MLLFCFKIFSISLSSGFVAFLLSFPPSKSLEYIPTVFLLIFLETLKSHRIQVVFFTDEAEDVSLLSQT